MPSIRIDPRLVQIGVENAPLLISLVKSMFAAKHPDVPQPTSAEVLAIFDQAYFASLAKDDAILANHPPTP